MQRLGERKGEGGAAVVAEGEGGAPAVEGQRLREREGERGKKNSKLCLYIGPIGG